MMTQIMFGHIPTMTCRTKYERYCLCVHEFEYVCVCSDAIPNEQLKTPVNDAHSVPLLQLNFDFNASGWTWRVRKDNRNIIHNANEFGRVSHWTTDNGQRTLERHKMQIKIEITCGHDVVTTRVQFSNWISVPLRRVVACICGQKPLVFVRHHSPHDAHGQ